MKITKLFLLIPVIYNFSFISCSIDTARVDEAPVGTLIASKNIGDGKEAPRNGFDLTPEKFIPVNIGGPDYGTLGKNSPARIIFQTAHTKKIRMVRYTPDGKYILTLSDVRDMKIWTRDGLLIKNLLLPKPPYSEPWTWFYITTDGRKIVLYERRSRTVMFTDYNGKVLKKLAGRDLESPHSQYPVTSLDRKKIVTTDSDIGKCRKWIIRDSSNFKKIKEISFKWGPNMPHLDNVTLSRDGRYLAAWAWSSPFTTAEGWPAAAVLYSDDGTLLRYLEVKTGSMSADTKEPDTVFKKIDRIIFSPNDTYIALIRGRTVHIRKINGELICRIKPRAIDPDGTRRPKSVKTCFFTPDGLSIILVSTTDNWVDHGPRTLIAKYDINGTLKGQTYRQNVFYDPSMISPDWKSYVSPYGEGNMRIMDNRCRLIRDIYSTAVEIKNVSADPAMKQFFLELKRGVKSLNYNTGSYQIDTIEGSVYFDSRGREYRFTYDPRYHKKNFVIKSGSKEFRLKDTNWGWNSIIPDGNFAYRQGSRIDIHDLRGNPVKRINFGPSHSFPGGNNISYGRSSTFFMVPYNRMDLLNIFDMNGKKTGRFITDSVFTVFAGDRSGRYIAVGYENGIVDLLTLKGKRVKRFKGHARPVNSIDFSHDGKYIITSSKDRMVKIFNIATGNVLSLVVFTDGNWALYDDDGRFDCSDGARSYIRFIKGFDIFEFQQLWTKLFTPGLLTKVIKGIRIRTESIDLITQKTPEVKISRIKSVNLSPGKASFRICTASAGTGRLFIIHNGRHLDENSRGLSINRQGRCSIFNILLEPGRNILAGAAYDRDTIIYGTSPKLEIFYQPQEIVRPDIHMLSVGVSKYRDRNIRLDSPAGDAFAIANVFKKTGRGLYGKVSARIIVNNSATRNAILEAMKEISAHAKKQDTVILFLAGHGDMHKGNYYFLGYDADINDLSGSCISISDINRFCSNVSANKIALFLDTCKSGSVTKALSTMALTRGFEDRKVIASLAKERGIAVFSAASTGQDAYEIKKLGHGIFTYCMLDAFENRKREISRNGIISITRLLGVVNRTTRDTAQKYLGVEQSPILYMFGDDFSLGKVD